MNRVTRELVKVGLEEGEMTAVAQAISPCIVSQGDLSPVILQGVYVL